MRMFSRTLDEDHRRRYAAIEALKIGLHHGAVDGVTGSCHELMLGDGRSVLIDCGLFQGAETASDGSGADRPGSTSGGSDPGADPDPCAHRPRRATAAPPGRRLSRTHPLQRGIGGAVALVLEDALKVGVTRDAALIEAVLRGLRARLVPLPYGDWYP
jgi:metallo-beta-lactamase family protein